MTKYVIGGAGEVGYNLAKALSAEEEAEVTVIESNPARLERAAGLDVQVLEGNMANRHFLKSPVNLAAGTVFIACSGNDEVNLLSCAIAKQMGCRTIARINDTQYMQNMQYSTAYRDIGVDTAVCPEMVAAVRIQRLLNQGELINSQLYLKGKVLVAEARIRAGSPVEGKAIHELEAPPGFTMFAIFRGDDVVIPHRKMKLLANDRILVACRDKEVLNEIKPLIGEARTIIDAEKPMHRIMIDGASRVGIHLAKLMGEHPRRELRREVALLEPNQERATRAKELLSRTHVYDRNGTDRSDLLRENVDTFDAFVGASNDEGHNVLACLLAKSLGIRRVICVVHQPEHKLYLEGDLLDTVIAPRLSTVGAMLKVIKEEQGIADVQLQNLGNSSMATIRIEPNSHAANKSIKELGMGDFAVIAAVHRDGDVHFPRGEFVLLPEDEVLVYTTTESFGDVEERLT